MVRRTCCSTWAGVPLMNQTARGILSISVIRAASLASWRSRSCTICCVAAGEGEGTKNRVPGPKARETVAAAGAIVAAWAPVATDSDAVAKEAVAAAAAAARRIRRKRTEAMITRGTIPQGGITAESLSPAITEAALGRLRCAHARNENDVR